MSGHVLALSGGVGGATAGTLTFMVGGPDGAFAKAKPILEKMGKTESRDIQDQWAHRV